ncbi:MAG: Gfo/Idh/MocA family oxidoreductase [Pseudomonadota bacterium]
MSRLRAAVIGVGYLGNFHAQKYYQHPGVELVAVVDTDRERAIEVAKRYDAQPLTDFADVLERVDLVSIVVPPAYHFDIAQIVVERGIHALVEKPVTETTAQAQSLITSARDANAVLQVGHLERFNPLVRKLKDAIVSPTLIETQRFSAYQKRGTEVDVVIDLMIHDIDIVLNLIASPLKSVQSSGTAVMTNSIDIAHARMEFENGTVAELAASRVSQEPARSMKVYDAGKIISIDYMNHEFHVANIGEDQHSRSPDALVFETQSIPGTDVLNEEIESFINAIKSGTTPAVTGEDGKRALEVAIEVSERIPRPNAALAT